jgi:hypothetical protein
MVGSRFLPILGQTMFRGKARHIRIYEWVGVSMRFLEEFRDHRGSKYADPASHDLVHDHT